MDPYEFSEDFEEPGKKPSSSPFKTSLQILKTSSDASAASTSGESAQQQKESLKISTEEKMPLPANSGKDEAILEVSGSSTLKLVQQEGDQKAEGGSKILEAEAEASTSTRGKPAALPALNLLKRLDREAETVGASPLGSPLTPDSVDNAGTDRSSEREGSPAGVKDKRPKSRRSRGGTPNTEAGKRKPSAGDVGPGSPQTVVSERRQLALLRQQAKDSEKQMSPDTSFSRDGPSTPSSTSSTTRESRSANRRDGRGETPLHVACKKGDMVSARKLIDDGADVNAADNAGWTPLHEAANHGKEDVVRLLIIHGANLSVKGVDGLTPLMDAVINGHVGIAEALLKAGADPHCVNDKGESCLDLVADEREKFQDLFLSHGSSSNKGASESAAATIRKRKREGASSMEKDSSSSTKDHCTGKKESELEKTAQSNAAAPSPATTATTTAPSKKLKIVSESQYEDISEDEEESSKKDDVDDAVAVSDGAAKNTTGGGAPAVASSLPVVQGEEPSTDRADPQTSHVSSPIPEAVLVAAKTEVVAPPSTLATPPVNATLPTMPPARTLPVLKLRPPSPERTTATITMPSVLNADTPAVAIASEKPSPAATDISISPSPSTILPSTATLVKSAADLEIQSKAETPAVLPDVVKDNAGAALAGKQPDVEKSEPLTTPLEKSTEPHLFGTVPVHVPVHEALPVSPSAAETAASKAGVAVLSVESSAGAKSIKVSPLAESEKPQTTSPPTAATSVITSATATPPMASEVIQPSPVPVEISPSMEAKPVTQSSVRPLSVVSTTELTSPPIPANCSETEKNQPAEPPLPPPTHSSSTMLITESPLMTSVHPSPEAPLPPPAVVVSPPPSVPTKESPLTITAIRTLTAQTFAAPPVGSQKTDPSRKEKRLETKDKDTAALPLKLVLSGQSASPQAQNQPPLQERLMLTVKRSLKEPTGDEAGRTREAAVQRSEELAASSSGAAVDGAAPSGAGETAAPTRRDVQSPRASEPPSNSRKQKEEKPAKPMTRAQRAQAQASTQSAGPGRRRKEKPDEKQPRGRPASKRAAADADIQSGEDAGGLDTKPKRLPARLSPKKLKTGGKDEPSSSSKMIMEPPKSPVEMMTESPTRLPFKKRMAIRNEIEEFINQRRLVEENWKKYSNNFPMKIFPKGCNDYLIMRKNYSSEAALPKKLDAPLALPPALKDFFIEQSDERAKLVRAHLIERDRLIMGAEQETMRLHQRFSRISAGITIPYSACMIISEQDSNRPFPNLPLVPSRNRTSPRDLIKWLEESDDKFDYAKKELLTRHRLEAAMLRSKQRLDWAWKASDLNLVDPSCRNPEELNNLYVPEVVVEDFTLLQDQ